MTDYFKKYVAFTLAETLIVMGIIDIVSALTLPNLNSSTGEKEKTAKVKKLYRDLDDAFGRAQAVYGPYDEWFQNDTNTILQSTRFGERMTKFMKVSKIYDTATNQGCFKNTTVAKIAGGFVPVNVESDPNFYKIISADGTSIAFNKQRTWVIVDIDEPQKGNNKLGVDIFSFNPKNNSIVPQKCNTFDAYLTDLQSVGQNAVGWIIDYDNMDYLKLKNGKCPNGTTPTDENPRCK